MAGRILVVDDEPDVLELEQAMLTRAGYEVDVAADGPTALRLVDGSRYDLIILDVMMPGLDGFDVCREIKADPRHAGIPVLFLTARDEPKSLLKGFDAGASMYISKPFSEAKLLAMVQTLIAEQQG